MTSNSAVVIVLVCRINSTVNAASSPSSSNPIVYKTCESPHTDQDLCHYIIVRGDLSVGQIAAQAVHAAGGSVTETVPLNTVAVVLKVKDQQELLYYHERLTMAGLEHMLVIECDGEAMAIGLKPTRDRKRIRKVLSSLPLVK